MKKRIALLVLVMLFVLLGASCSPIQSSNKDEVRADVVVGWIIISPNFYRVIDFEAGVVCYSEGPSIDCLDIDETDLRKGQ
jgi:hypothetical protein